MVITPVSGIDAGSSVNKYMSFGHRRNNTDDVPDVRENRGSNNLAKVPVVVIMAMSPAMLNANYPKTNIETEAPAKTEMVAAPSKLDTEALDELTAAYPRVEELQQSGKYDYLKNKWHALRGQTIQDLDVYTSKGQRKYMVYCNDKFGSAGGISEVYLFPENFDQNKSLFFVPQVTELVYHDLGSPDKNFCSVKLENRYRGSDNLLHMFIKDERIPDEVAYKLVDLMLGRSKYKNNTRIKFSDTNSAALQPDKKIH